MKKLRNLIPALATGVLLTAAACGNNSQKAPVEEKQLSALYSTDNLSSQKYQVDPNRDTLLRGESGTVLRIYKNTFVDGSGKPVTSSVEVELKEALHPDDIVFANLTTTSDGRPLQTGGMIRVGATSNGQEVEIAGGKAIGVILPQGVMLENMQVYKGVETAEGINWIEPEPTLNKDVEQLMNKPKQPKARKQEVVGQPNDLDALFDYVDSETAGMQEATQDAKENKNAGEVNPFAREVAVKGINVGNEDLKTSYIFEMKKLGWANIDRLYEDPRTQEVELITQVSNRSEFKEVYITMVMSGMYLPGYEMKSGNFSFAHGDYEKQQLPVGQKGIVFATAYKDNVPYFALVPVTIQSAQTLTLDLKKTTEEKLKAELKSKL